MPPTFSCSVPGVTVAGADVTPRMRRPTRWNGSPPASITCGTASQRERRILELACHDRLTDLAHRSKFSERLAQSIGEVDASQRGSILVMDLDRFKYVNDALGHSVGDHVLFDVGKRLLETAPDAACIARLGGDEFAVLFAVMC